jgi:branched-chain amino acid transport system substrate-binding protein
VRSIGTVRWIACAAAACATLAACSSSGSGSGTNSPGSGGDLKASPIVIGGVGSLSNPAYTVPELKAAMEAAAADINAHGGIAGHPLKVNFCDTDLDPNKEISCIQQLASAKVSAILAPSVTAPDSIPVAVKAKIPVIGGQGLTPAELSGAGVFPLSSGLPGWGYGAAEALIAKGVKKISIVDNTTPGTPIVAGYAKTRLELSGITPLRTVVADTTSDPSLSTAAAKAASGADGIVAFVSPVEMPKLISSLRQNGYHGAIASASALFTNQSIKAMGSKADGILLSSQIAFATDTANTGVARFLKDMKSYQSTAQIDETAEFGWAAVELYSKVMATAGGFSPAETMQRFETLKAPVDTGIAAPYAVVGHTSPLPTLPRIFNPTVQNGVIKNGSVEPDGKGFVNPFVK